MGEEVNDYKCATCLIELEKYLIMRKYSLARLLAEYGDNYRRCEKSRDLYGQYDEIEKILKEIENIIIVCLEIMIRARIVWGNLMII